MRGSKTKLSLLLISAVFIASSAIQTISPMVARAAPVDDASVDDVAKAYAAVNFLRFCFNSFTYDMDRSQMLSFQWFKEDRRTLTPVGASMAGNGYKDCRDPGNVQEALRDSHNSTTPQDIICGLMEYDSKSSRGGPGTGCTDPGAAWFEDRHANGMDSKGYRLYTAFFGRADRPSLSNAVKYGSYMRAFASTSDTGCSAQDLGKFDSNNPTHVRPGVVKVWTAAGGQVEEHAFAIPDNRTQDGAATLWKTPDMSQYNFESGRRESIKCTDFQNAITRDMAQDYANKQRANQANSSPQTPAGGTGGGNSPEKITCQIEVIGWIVCPVVNLMAKMTDLSYNLVSELLRVQPLMTSGAGTDLYNAWTRMRNFANILFVIAFIIIIYSQMTTIGITNYGIKKMLPKLIVAAVFVNISFWVCAIAVDASNILGTSLNGLIGQQLPTSTNATSISTGSGWEGIAGAVLAGSVVGVISAYAGLTVLLPALIAVLATIVVVYIGLIMRQALIILLIVISPIAFVLYLFPNTSGLFKKWLDMFKALLLVFPLIAILFGASSLASKTIMAGADNSNALINLSIQIAGAAASILPLVMIKTIISGATSIIQRVSGAVNNPNKGPFDRMRRGADRTRERQQNRRSIRSMNGGRVFGGGQFRRRSRRDAIDQGIKQQKSVAEADYIAQRAQDSESFRNKVAGGTSLNQATNTASRSALANAINVQAKLTADQVTASKAVIENLNLPFEDLKKIAVGLEAKGMSGGDDITRRAAIQMALKKATVADAEDIIKSSGSMSTSAHQDVADTLVSSGLVNKATHLGGATLDKIAQGQVRTDEDLDNAVAYHINKGKYSAENIVNQDATSMQRVNKVLSSGSSPNGTVIEKEVKDDIVNSSNKVLRDPRLNTRINSKESRSNIEDISRM